MSIEINQPIILADEQIISFKKVTIEKRDVKINDVMEKEMFALVEFEVKDKDGNYIKTEEISYDDGAYNDFWNSFTNGKFLYDELKRIRQLNVVIPKATEEEFINVVEQI